MIGKIYWEPAILVDGHHSSHYMRNRLFAFIFHSYQSPLDRLLVGKRHLLIKHNLWQVPSTHTQQHTCSSAVREITKSSSTFPATNISSNIVWSISTARYNRNEIKWNLILVPNLVAFISQNEKNVWFFDYHLLTCSVRKMALICLMQNIDMYLLYKSHQIARLVSHLINHFSKWMFTV